MKKYNIEGNIDFFSELYELLDKEEIQENNVCLITNEPLTDKYVELCCGHKFNYYPLYKDIINHKHKFNNMESTNGSLKQNEIRCPYCRKKQSTLLPYYEELGLEKVSGVNFIDSLYNYNYSNLYTDENYKQCEYLIENPNFNKDLPISEYSNNPNNIVNFKYFKCNKYGTKISSQQHNELSMNDEKCYCW